VFQLIVNFVKRHFINFQLLMLNVSFTPYRRFLQPDFREESGPICFKCTMTKAPGWITIAAGPEVTDDCYMKLLFSGEDDDVDSDDDDNGHYEVLWDRELSTSDDEDSLNDYESDY